MKKSYLACFALLLAAASSLHAQLVINGVLDADTSKLYRGKSGRSTSTNIIAASEMPMFTYAFGDTPGADTIQITWSAPEGKRFAIETPSDITLAIFDAIMFSGGTGGFEVGITAGSVQFAGLDRAMTLRFVDSVLLENSSTYFRFSASYALQAGQRYTFTSLTFTATVSAGVLLGSNQPAEEFYFRTYAENTNHIAADPGFWFSVEDAPSGGGGAAVPEPSTYAVIAGGAALGLAAWRRRRVASAA